MKKRKKKKEFEIGDHVRETTSSRGKRKVGEIVAILQDNPGDPTVECVEVDANELTPLEGSMGELKRFKTKRSKLKHYTPRKKLFKKKVIEVGCYVRYKRGTSTKYGRVSAFVHPDGLYPNSYEGEYNGKDLLECVEIDPKPGLLQVLEADGSPKIFTVPGDKCKLIKVIDVDAKGNPTTAIRLDIPQDSEE